ncbi:MAG TPA: DUF4019 domain-containing protein [Spirochaetia bacterium]|nr:DUF4019 domain-containing protein [Spirochaetia bacterium]
MSDCRPCAEMSFRTAARACALVLCSLLAASCGFRHSRIVAEQAVKDFHGMLDRRQYEAIYNAGDDSLRTTMTKADFVQYLQGVRDRLGTVIRADSRGFQLNSIAGQGTRVALSVETEFERGTATERFIWRIDDDRALLVLYTATVEKTTAPQTVRRDQRSSNEATRLTSSGYFPTSLFFFKFSRTIHWRSASPLDAVSSSSRNPSRGLFSAKTLSA